MAVDTKKLLDQFLNSGMATGLVAGMLGGALARRTGLGGIAKVGGVALVGTLAYQAWQRYQQQQGQLPPDQRSQGGMRDTLGGVLANIPGLGDVLKSAESNPAAAEAGFGANTLSAPAQNQLGTAVLTAMIAAAKADGEVDRAESQKIFGQMEQAGLSGEEKAFLLSELAKPLNIEDVAKHAATPEVAAQLFTASAIVIGQPNDRERDYLAMLAQRLNIPQGFIDQLSAQMSQ